MKNKLTLEHLSAYLPYGVHLMNEYGYWHNTTLNKSISIYRMLEMKPILRPLSYLTEKIDNNPNNLTYSAFLKLWTEEDIHYCKSNPLGMPYETIQQLIEWHFDVFGLIDKGLAIDINTLKY